MFLTHGDLPHEALWTAWMGEARGLLPRGSLAGDDAFCLQQCDAAGGARAALLQRFGACVLLLTCAKGTPACGAHGCGCWVVHGESSMMSPPSRMHEPWSTHTPCAAPPPPPPQAPASSSAAAPRPATRCAWTRCSGGWGRTAAPLCCSSSTSSRFMCTPGRR